MPCTFVARKCSGVKFGPLHSNSTPRAVYECGHFGVHGPIKVNYVCNQQTVAKPCGPEIRASLPQLVHLLFDVFTPSNTLSCGMLGPVWWPPPSVHQTFNGVC